MPFPKCSTGSAPARRACPGHHVEKKTQKEPGITGAVAKLIEDTQEAVKRQFDFAKARGGAKPHLFETAYASADIVQMHLARARARIDPPDLLLQPDMRDATPTSFDRADEFIEEGRRVLMAERGKLESLLKI